MAYQQPLFEDYSEYEEYEEYEGDEDYEIYADIFADANAAAYYDETELASGIELDLASPGPGLITFVTLLICAGLVVFLLRLAAGIVIPTVIQSVPAMAVPQPAADPPAAANPAITGASEAAAAVCQVSTLFPEKVLRWCSLISFYAAKHNLSPDLIAALIWQESGGNETAYSRSGAVGLMQVMPSDGLAASFMCVNGPCFSDRPSTNELQDPEYNIAWGTKYLAGLLRRHGDMREALKSYGPMNVGYYYADKVLGLFDKYKTPTP